MPSTPSQARYWLLTIAHASFVPYLPKQCNYIKGQLELGAGGFLHWQVLVAFKNKIRLGGVRDIFGPHHAEAARSNAASDYVWKDDTSIEGTRFELGNAPIQRGSSTDWAIVVASAKSGRLDDIPPDVLCRYYGNLRRIHADNLQPAPLIKEVVVYWGATGVGKSRRAWAEAGMDSYPKDPRSKFWDGYRGQTNVVIDEFRGGIDISHMLRWLDRYPVIVEIKGSSVVLSATKIWITSNLSPLFWYPELDALTRDALIRRMTIIELTGLEDFENLINNV